METTTAYCKNCNRNTSAVNTMTWKWIQRNIVWIILAMISFPIISWVFLILMFIVPSNSLYCTECGARIGTKTEAKNRCVYCDAEMEPNAVYCPKCGKKSKVSRDSVVCKKCKTENAEGSRFCAKCGTKLPMTNHKVKKDDKPAEYGWQAWD